MSNRGNSTSEVGWKSDRGLPARGLALGPSHSLVKGCESTGMNRFSSRARSFNIAQLVYLRSHSPAVVILAGSGPWVINLLNHFGFAPVRTRFAELLAIRFVLLSRFEGPPNLEHPPYFSILVSRAPGSTGPFWCSWCIGNTLRYTLMGGLFYSLKIVVEELLRGVQPS